MKLITTASIITVALFVGVVTVDAQGRSNSAPGRSNGAARGNAPATPPGLERKDQPGPNQQIQQVPEPATLALLGLAVGGGLLARGLHARRRRK